MLICLIFSQNSTLPDHNTTNWTMNPTTPVKSFSANDVDRLPDTHYSEHGEDCYICKEADIANCSGDAANGTISLTSVIKTKKCGHCLHEACLH